MLVRLGYVAMTLNLKDCSPSKTVTLKTLNKIDDEKAKLYKLKKVTETNLKNTLRILRYNVAYNIYVYRFSSKLVPLATHPDIYNWKYDKELAEEFKEIGDFVKENDLRVSAHPDHYTVINSPNKNVFEKSVKDLEYHHKMFSAMGFEDNRYKLILHVGGLYKNKKLALNNFVKGFYKLPKYIKNKIIIENDDKSFTSVDVLKLCHKLNVPMVLDVHHDTCNNEGECLDEILPYIFDTWNNEYFNPKVHFSSPKSEKQFRSHADDINTNDFIKFLNSAKKIDRDIDIMLEAKNKDNALFKLMNNIKENTDIKIINESTFEI